jgi:hypothetical protein
VFVYLKDTWVYTKNSPRCDEEFFVSVSGYNMTTGNKKWNSKSLSKPINKWANEVIWQRSSSG